MFPDFIGIGAQKAGTTWLARNLAAHPQIWMPPIKEIHYFDRPPDWRDPVRLRTSERKGRASLKELYWERKYNKLPRDDRWYASLFRPKKGQIAGEITPAYAVLDEADISRVRNLMPDARILFFMRNPVERTWSQTMMYFDRYGRSAEAATDGELREHFELERVRRRAEYLRTLESWSRFYPEERIFVGFLEDTRFHPAGLLSHVYEFLGVDATFTPPDATQKVHSRSSASMPAESARTLSRAYHKDLVRLREQFGGYASFWSYCAERLMDGSLGREGRVAYPLWESPAWEDWARECGQPATEDGPQSKPLSRFQA